MSNDLSEKAANEQLTLCPFCGGKAQGIEHVIPVTRISDFRRRRMTSEFRYGITCRECGAMSNQYYETMGEAVDAWNTRRGTNIDSVPAVPQEMSAREFFPKWAEICATYLPDDCYHCPLYLKASHRKFTPPCMLLILTDSEQVIPIVEKWAWEH